MSVGLRRTPLQASSVLPENTWSNFGQFRSGSCSSCALKQLRAPEAAQDREKANVPETARSCSKLPETAS
eukprot:11740119-Alexandrium_andersonii.AAC.1